MDTRTALTQKAPVVAIKRVRSTKKLSWTQQGQPAELCPARELNSDLNKPQTGNQSSESSAGSLSCRETNCRNTHTHTHCLLCLCWREVCFPFEEKSNIFKTSFPFSFYHYSGHFSFIFYFFRHSFLQLFQHKIPNLRNISKTPHAVCSSAFVANAIKMFGVVDGHISHQLPSGQNS